jgi:hypothetical protein
VRVEARKEALMERRADRGMNRAGAVGDGFGLRPAFVARDRVELAVGVRDARASRSMPARP